MVSWWASKLACQGGFEDQAQGSEKADLSAQNGRFSRAESVPSPRAQSSAADEGSMGEPELSLETSDVSLTYQGVTADGGLFLNFQQDGKKTSASKPEPASLRKLRISESLKHGLKDRKAAKQLQDLAQQGKTGSLIVQPLSSRPEVPPLTLVLMCTGTRGDVQPFIALGLKLKAYGHRVRLASHKPYRQVITEVGLEYYPLGGDPKVLSEYIVKNRGIIPTSAKDALLNYKQVEDVLFSTFDACTKPDLEGPHKNKPFKAQAIISNPPCYGHVHCAEKMQIPLHLLFTMPWTPTKAFPHPLARLNVVADTTMTGLRNQLSYSVVNEMVFSGLGHMVNKFRRDVLQLPPLRLADHGASMLETNRIPFTYCWSPTVVPKPPDWGAHIDVTGYLFLNESKLRTEGYTPPQDLADFLAAGPPPVYIGFGSLIVDDPKGVSEKILAAARHVQPAGQRILLSRGWGNLGDGLDIPDNVLQLDAVPHDWLLPQCSAVVHHGGAGTTAAGLLAECPTLVVPFFGDQAFWGAACHRLGVGPSPIPIDKLTTEGLTEALEYMRRPEAREAAKAAAADIRAEDGVEQCMAAFHHHLPLEDLVAGRPVNYSITEAHLTDVVTESLSGAVGFFTIPVEGARKGGFTGGVQGFGKGLLGTAFRPFKGLYLSGAAAGQLAGIKGPHQVYLIQKRGSPVKPPKAELGHDDVERRSFMMNMRERLKSVSGRHSGIQEAQPSGDEALPAASEDDAYSDSDNATPTGTSFRYKVMPIHVEEDEKDAVMA